MFQKLIDNYLIEELLEMLKEKIGSNDITYKRMSGCIMFFLDNGSILQIIPDNDERLTYANNPIYASKIEDVLNIFKLKLNRNEKIEDIIKKES